MKLELKHLAPYLPYKLKIKFDDEDFAEIVGLKLGRILLISDNGDFGSCNIGAGKIILRPLSDLTKEIEVNGERFVPIEMLTRGGDYYYSRKMCDNISNIWHLKNQIFYYHKLFEWHFDVFGLIEKGLAIDINTLND